MGLYSGLAAGGNLITTGLLDATLMLSYEHLILLDEMVPHVRSMLAGVRADEFAPAVSEIQTHGHPKPGFLTSDYTLQNMKRDIYYSDYSGRTEKSYEDWYETAHRKVQDIFRQRSNAPALRRRCIGALGRGGSPLERGHEHVAGGWRWLVATLRARLGLRRKSSRHSLRQN